MFFKIENSILRLYWLIYFSGFLFNNVAAKDTLNPLLENDHGYGIVKNVSSSDTGQSKRETLESFLISKIELPAHDKTDERQHNFVVLMLYFY